MTLALLALATSIATLQSSSLTLEDIPSWSGVYDRHSIVHHDVDANGTLWARGRGYKASVDSSGFTFIPFLGSDAPQNHPLGIHLGEVRRGSETMAIEEAPTFSHEEDRIVLNRGPVRVRYDLSPEGVEQSFELSAASGSGDLVLSLSVETEFNVFKNGKALRFSNARGGVNYGAAVVFDSADRRVDVATTWAGNQIHLTVPAAFLDEAAWPIVVDPLLTPFSIGTSSADLESPDVSYDRVSERYCVVFEERFSGADVDVFTWYVGTDGTVSNGAYVEQTSASWSAPRVSVTLDVGSAFIVAQGDSIAVPGSTDIVLRVRQPDGTLDASSVIRSATTTFGCAAPDLGTDRFWGEFSTQVLAYNRVYPGQRDIYTMVLSHSGVSTERPLAVDLTHDTSAPAVSDLNDYYHYIVGWSERELASSASSVRTARVDFSGGGLLGPYTIAGPSTNAFYFDVDVSGAISEPHPTLNQPVYLVTYDDRPSNVTDAFVALCAGGTVLNTYELQLSEHADRTPNQNDVRVATGWDKFTLGYEEDGELHMTIVQPIGDELGILERRRVALGSDLAPGSLAAAPALFSGGQNWRALFVWSQQGSSFLGISGSFANIPVSFGAAAGVQYCYGTANSTGDRGFLQIFGSRDAGEPHSLRVEALPPQAFGYYLASTTTGNVVQAGGSQGTLCVGGSIGRFGIYQTDALGVATGPLTTLQIPQPMGAVAAMAGERWHFQSWYRDAIMGTPTSNFTNAATLPFR